MKFKKIFSLLLIISVSYIVGLVNCPFNEDGECDREDTESKVLYSAGSSKKICQIVGDIDRELGEATINQTYSKYGLWGTDLGVSFEFGSELFFLFGDTVGEHSGDSIAMTTDRNPEDCIELTFITGDDGYYLPPQVPGISLGPFEVPMEGVTIDNIMYVYFTTDHSPENVMGRSILARSKDKAHTFEYLYDVSTEKFRNVSVEIIDNSEIKGLPEKIGKGLLIWGSGEYRKSNVYLAYLPVSSIEEKEKMLYFAGRDKKSNCPIWSSKESSAIPLFHQPCVGELSVSWNPYLEKWIILYNCDNPRGINLRASASPWGSWSDPQVIFEPWEDKGYCHFIHVDWDYDVCDYVHDPGREYEWGGEYGPYMIPPFTTGSPSESTIYYTLSTWNPYTVVLMKSTLRLIP